MNYARVFRMWWVVIALAVATHSACAKLTMSFEVARASWTASHIVVVETTPIDGIFEVVESWKGDLAVGSRVVIPELIPPANAIPISAYPKWSPNDRSGVLEQIPKQPVGSQLVVGYSNSSLRPCEYCFDESLYFGQCLPQQVVFSAKPCCQHVISILKLFEPPDLFLRGTKLGSQLFNFLSSNIGTDDFLSSNIGTDDVTRIRKLLEWLPLSLRLCREGFKLLAIAVPPIARDVFMLRFAMTAVANLVAHLLSPRSASRECTMMVPRAFRRCKTHLRRFRQRVQLQFREHLQWAEDHDQLGQLGTFIQ
jgi:hypothetical protein